MPRVSVVSGYYNRGPLLERTIESVLGQTFEDFELVVFDDCSTDDTAQRLEELAQRYQDPRLRFVVHDQNKGFVQGLLDAIEQTSGEFVAIQGSGDVSMPRRLSAQVALLDARPEVVAVGGWLYNVQEGLGTKKLRQSSADSMGWRDLLKTNAFTHGEVMFRRDAYEQAGRYRAGFTFAQDRDLWLRMAKLGALATVPEVIYHRYSSLDGVSFVPAKVVRQRSFATAAARLAEMSAEDEAAAYAKLVSEGPTAVVPLDDPEVQEFVPKAAVRLALYGAPEAALQLADEYLAARFWRVLVRTFVKCYSWPLMRPVRPMIRSLLRM